MCQRKLLNLPIFGVTSRNHDLDEDLIVIGFGNGGVNNLDLDSGMNNGFLHCGKFDVAQR